MFKKITQESLQGKTPAQVIRLIARRFRGYDTASETVRAQILADLMTVKTYGNIVSVEWNNTLKNIGLERAGWLYDEFTGESAGQPESSREGLKRAGTDAHLQQTIPELDGVTGGQAPSKPPKPPKVPTKPRGHGGHRAGAGLASKQRSDDHLQPILPVITEALAQGCTLQAIADRLNGQGFTTQQGRPYNRQLVCNIIKRKGLKGLRQLQPNKIRGGQKCTPPTGNFARR